MRATYFIVIHQHCKPGFDRLHEVTQQMFLHFVAAVVCQTPHVDGTTHLRVRQVSVHVTKLFRALQDAI